MATLGNVQGGSFVPAFGDIIMGQLGPFRERRRQEQSTDKLEDSLRTSMGLPPLDRTGTPFYPGMDVLGRLAPDVARSVAQTNGDPVAVSEFRGEAQRGLTLARELSGLDHNARLERLNVEAARVVGEGGDIERLVGLSNMSPDQLELELQKMEMVGTGMLDAVPEFSPQDSFRILSDPKRAGAFARIMATNPGVGQMMLAQREKLLNADERKRLAAARAAAQARAPKTPLAQLGAALASDVANGYVSQAVADIQYGFAADAAQADPNALSAQEEADLASTIAGTAGQEADTAQTLAETAAAAAQLPDPGFDIPADTMLVDPLDPRAGVTAIPGLPPAATEKTAAEQKIARLMEPNTDFPDGMPREIAVGIVDGRVIASRDPITNEVTLVDKASRKVIQLDASAPDAGQTGAAQQVAPTSDVAENTFGEQYPNLANTFGTTGLVRDALNTASEAVGAPAPFKDQLRSTSDMQVFAEDMLVDMVRGYGQRVPVFVLKSLNELTPKTGNPFVGPDKAQAKLSGLGSRMVIETNSLETQLQDRRLSPQGRLEIEGQIASLRTGIQRIQTVLSAFDRTPQLQNLTVDPDVQDLVDKWSQ